jgi:hypothetical protein
MTDLVHRRLRAPQEDGAALIDSPLQEIEKSLESNKARVAGESPLAELVAAARSSVMRRALQFTSQYRSVSATPTVKTGTPFLFAGHQPELFHPGVWFKNFLLSSLGDRFDGIAINLIVDNDTIRSSSILVPAHGSEPAEVKSVPLDVGLVGIPYEDRGIEDRTTFLGFADAVERVFEPPTDILLRRLWPAAIESARRPLAFRNLGLALAEARHRLEGEYGLRSLELPLSEVCRTAGFQEFVLRLLLELVHFHRTYNRSLHEYRRVNHIRSRSHPVPDLETFEDWLEAPFWVWTAQNPRRQRLFVAYRASSIELTDRAGWRVKLSAKPSGNEAVQTLEELEEQGIKLRPRALITTMYVRLVLSDLFIHGIGGAKYDELTDAIIRRFFGIEPPKYITATATFRLPIDRPQVTADDLRASARKLRDTRYHPESLLRDPLVRSDTALSEQLAALAAEKRAYLERHDLRRCEPKVFHRLDSINCAMHTLLAPVERELRAERSKLLDDFRRSQLLGSREFSFCLFPENLPARLLDLCRAAT